MVRLEVFPQVHYVPSGFLRAMNASEDRLQVTVFLLDASKQTIQQNVLAAFWSVKENKKTRRGGGRPCKSPRCKLPTMTKTDRQANRQTDGHKFTLQLHYPTLHTSSLHEFCDGGLLWMFPEKKPILLALDTPWTRETDDVLAEHEDDK